LTDAIAAGALKSSPALAERLARAEQELPALEKAATRAGRPVTQLVPWMADEYRGSVSELEAVLSPAGLDSGLVSQRDIARSRAAVRRRLGERIVVRETLDEILFETEAALPKSRWPWSPEDRTKIGSGGRIRTYDLRVMSPTSYQAAPPRTGRSPASYRCVPPSRKVKIRRRAPARRDPANRRGTGRARANLLRSR
jgi:hypothetical protein